MGSEMNAKRSWRQTATFALATVLAFSGFSMSGAEAQQRGLPTSRGEIQLSYDLEEALDNTDRWEITVSRGAKNMTVRLP